jgi:DAK2 domain fusion protein YloV
MRPPSVPKAALASCESGVRTYCAIWTPNRCWVNYGRAVGAAAFLELERARELARAALANLEANRQRLDDLNVYPVPDGDTGTNLTLTVRSIVAAIEDSTAERPEALASEITRAALLGSRGNSGVIFSQIVRGFADVAGEHEQIDTPVLARAFRSASDTAYSALREPVEGTILTVVREMAEEGEHQAAQALAPGAFLDRMVVRGEQAVARTPELLDKLREAGVVDSGGAGLVEIVRGLAAGVSGEPIAAIEILGDTFGVDAIHQELSRYRFCTTFVVAGDDLDAELLERELGQIGDSLLVVGDASALKAHVHTDDHAAAIALGARLGEILEPEVADMHEQTREREERLAAVLSAGDLRTGVVVVAPGEGNRELFESFVGCRVIEGGQTMNPSTEEILEAIEATPAPAVVVLPNNSNVILSAEQAAKQASKPVRIVRSRSVAAGLAAIGRYVPSLSAEDNETLMVEALAHVATGEVTRASRDAAVDGVAARAGEWLGLVDERAVVSGKDFEAIAVEVVERALEGGKGLLTLLTGDEEVELESLVARIAARHPAVEVEVHHGGQPHYPLFVLAE